MKVQDINCMIKQKYKGSENAVILGSGSSINNISKEEWRKISLFDTWSLNNWMCHHPFVPKFYHLELKRDFDFWKERRDLKGIMYDRVIFIIQSKKYELYSKAIGKDNKIFTYEIVQHWNPKRENIPLPNNFNLDSTKITKAYSSSIPVLLDIIYKMKYKNIITFGIDLNNSKYFWTGRPDLYGAAYEDTNKNYPVAHPHNTFGVQNYIKAFNERFLKKNRINFYVGHKDTLLYTTNILKKINILDLK